MLYGYKLYDVLCRYVQYSNYTSLHDFTCIYGYTLDTELYYLSANGFRCHLTALAAAFFQSVLLWSKAEYG